MAGVWDTPPTDAEKRGGVWDAPPTPEEMGGTPPPGGPSAFIRNAAQMLPAGFGNQLMAADVVAKGRLVKAGAAALSGGGVGGAVDALTAPGVVDEYRHLRDDFTAGQEAASEADPVGAFAGKAVGIIPSLFVPGGASLKGAMASGAALGGADALAESKADLTKGEVGQAAVDTLVGGAGGAAGGAAGFGLGKALGWVGSKISGRAERGVAQAGQQISAEEAAKAASATATARSEAGNAAQAAYRKLEHLRELDGKGLLTDEGRALAADLEAELARKAAAELPEAAAKKAATADAYREAMASEAARAEAGAAGRSVWGQVAPRLKRYGLPLAGQLVGGYVGNEIGGTPGALVGATIGGAAAGFKRPMQHALKRMFQSPEVRRAAWAAVQGGVERLGKYGLVLQRAATQDGVDFAQALHEALLKTDSDYQQKVGALLENPQEVQ